MAGSHYPQAEQFHGLCQQSAERRQTQCDSAAAIALSRLAISMAFGQAEIDARMFAASSVRGLSSKIWSAPVLAICPILARLLLSRSPPQPNNTTSLPVAAGRSAAGAQSGHLGYVHNQQ